MYQTIFSLCFHDTAKPFFIQTGEQLGEASPVWVQASAATDHLEAPAIPISLTAAQTPQLQHCPETLDAFWKVRLTRTSVAIDLDPQGQ